MTQNTAVSLFMYVLLFFVWILAMALLAIRKYANHDRYGKALWIIKKFPILVDKNNQSFITNRYCAVIALRAGDNRAARKFLDTAMRLGKYPLDYIVLCIIDAKEGDWAEASRVLQTVKHIAATDSPSDKTDWTLLEDLLKKRDSASLEQLVFTTDFHVMVDERIDLLYADMPSSKKSGLGGTGATERKAGD